MCGLLLHFEKNMSIHLHTQFILVHESLSPHDISFEACCSSFELGNSMYLNWDTRHPEWSFVAFFSPPTQMPGYYLNSAMTLSFQILSHSSNIHHSTLYSPWYWNWNMYEYFRMVNEYYNVMWAISVPWADSIRTKRY
jgi:hypothetical protein